MKTRIIFHSVTQDGLEFGSTDERSVSRVYFDLERGDEQHGGLFVDLEEPADAEHDASEVKVGPFESPVTIKREAFEKAVCSYYESLVTSAGFGKHLAKGKGFRTHGDTLGLEQVIEL